MPGDRAPLCNGNYKPPTGASAPDSVVNMTLFKNSHEQRTAWITVMDRIDFKDCKFSGGAGTLFAGKPPPPWQLLLTAHMMR
jgi:hypothetical protein